MLKELPLSKFIHAAKTIEFTISQMIIPHFFMTCMVYTGKHLHEKMFILEELTLTSSVSFTRRICSRRSWRSLNVDCAVMEYTKANPWPFFMYRSLIAVNCSYKKQKPEGGAISRLCASLLLCPSDTLNVTYCSSCVEDFQHTLLPIDLDLLLNKNKTIFI